MKRIQRNAFSEKLIHRYLFERLYFGENKIRRSLLEDKYRHLTINLIVPEKNTKNNYIADLTIYFKELEEGVPVEVKWNSQSSFRKNQEQYLKKNNGFIIAFNDLKNPHVKTVTIDPDDFQKWISNNISKLTEESLIYHAGINKLSFNQSWLIFLRGDSYKNWNKMLTKYQSKPFWAFSNKYRSALKNLFDIRKGDKCIFIIGTLKGENQGIKSNPKGEWEFNNWFLTTVKEPYYMEQDKKIAQIFEEDYAKKNNLSLPIILNKRPYPHFINFKIDEFYNNKDGRCYSSKIAPKWNSGKTINYGKRGELDSIMCESLNYGGCPAPISNGKFKKLIDKLRAISPIVLVK